MITYVKAKIQELWIHYIGNASQEEGIQYSYNKIAIPTLEIDDLLKSYFFDNFKEPDFNSFDFIDGNIDLNPLYNYSKSVFNHPDSLAEEAANIAKFLYNNSKHPNIKSGDLIIAYVTDVLIEDELVDALCIFKSENKQAFINLEKKGDTYYISDTEGINAGKLDKACIIFNTEEETGFKICAKDHSNKSKEAQFWISDFLNLKPKSDDYHHTKHYIQATKAFVTERLRPMYELDKTEEADILNTSLDFLKQEDQLNQEEFDSRVFKKPELVNEFQLFKLDFQQERNVELADNFNVHHAAVKNSSKVFKSVLKLDKNFHIYIHGNRNMIEKGVDPDGRKFYKVYYENEQ